jgi:hypothetical protein
MVGALAVVIFVAGFIYSRSDSFKAECGAHKAFGASMGVFKNAICDLDFTVDG